MRFLVIAATLLLSGCALKPVIPYTDSEKMWLGFAVAGQAADYASTDMAIDRGCVEANRLYWSRDAVMVGKFATGAFIYLAANKMGHDERKWFLPIASVIGWGAAGYNETLACH